MTCPESPIDLRNRPLRVESGLSQRTVADYERILKRGSCQSLEFGMPFSFLFVLVLILCAVISPLIAAGVIWALRVQRWRYTGERAGTTGGILAAKFIATYFVLHALFGNAIPIQPMSIAVVGGAGFTVGALVTCAWIWMRSTRA